LQRLGFKIVYSLIIQIKFDSIEVSSLKVYSSWLIFASNQTQMNTVYLLHFFQKVVFFLFSAFITFTHTSSTFDYQYCSCFNTCTSFLNCHTFELYIISLTILQSWHRFATELDFTIRWRWNITCFYNLQTSFSITCLCI